MLSPNHESLTLPLQFRPWVTFSYLIFFPILRENIHYFTSKLNVRHKVFLLYIRWRKTPSIPNSIPFYYGLYCFTNAVPLYSTKITRYFSYPVILLIFKYWTNFETELDLLVHKEILCLCSQRESVYNFAVVFFYFCNVFNRHSY